MSTVALLVNPTAGKGKAAGMVARAVERLHEGGCDVAILVGRDVAHATELGRTAVAEGVDAVVALGGDGMVHLALNVVAGTPTPLGIIAAGTGNDLATMLDLPVRDAVAGAAVIADKLQGTGARAMDAVRAAGKWFGCVLGSGFDSRVNDRANRLTWPRGPMRYNVAILAELPVFKPLPFVIDIDGDRWETDAMMVAIGNARSYGAGMQVCPAARIDDGLLDITVIEPISKIEFLKTFPKVYKGTHVNHPRVTCRQARVVSLSSPGVTAYADGEFLTDLPVTCEVVPGAVQVLA